jgi:hypothetical protein
MTQMHGEEETGWRKTVVDTIGGCGNGLMSAAKGVTEVYLLCNAYLYDPTNGTWIVAGISRSWKRCG